jgi:hypothetical protein
MWINVNDELPAPLVPVLIILAKGTYVRRYREITGYLSEYGRWWGYNEEGNTLPIPAFSGKIFVDEKIEVVYWQYIESFPDELSRKMQEEHRV